jgi:hypothetical protein
MGWCSSCTRSSGNECDQQHPPTCTTELNMDLMVACWPA